MNGQAEQSSTSYTAAADNTKKRTEYEDPDGSFRQYMRIKQQKLVDQLPIAQSQLFSKVTAYITGIRDSIICAIIDALDPGYTGNEIGDLELKRLIHSNGGRVV
jgi:hypothetical protein